MKKAGDCKKKLMSLVVDREQLGETVYLLYFALMVGARASGLYDGMPVYNAILVIAMVMFMAKMLITRHSLMEYVVAALFMGVAGVVYLHTGEKGLLVCFTMMLGMKGVSERNAIKIGAVVACGFILTKIFLGVFGFVPEIYYPQERKGVGLMFRHALGYAHPNTLHMNVLMLSMMVVYLTTEFLKNIQSSQADRNKRKTGYSVFLLMVSLVVLAINIYVFQYSGSRTGLLASIVYLIVNLWFFCRRRIGLIEELISYFSFPVVSVIAIVLPLTLSGGVYDFLNYNVFNTRFDIARYFWKYNNVSLWGIRLVNPKSSMKTYGIDMAQLYLFLQLGIVAFSVITVLTMWYVNQAIKKDKRAELAILITVLFAGIWEPFLYNLAFKNFVYVFMGAMLYTWLHSISARSDSLAMESVNANESIPSQSEYQGDYRMKSPSCFGLWLLKLRNLIVPALISAGIGIAVLILYLAVTKPPAALYGDKEKKETGRSLGMEAVYLTEEDIRKIRDSGDLIIGYVDAETPMYRYNSVIAGIEYRNRAMSAGVWSAFLAMCISTLYNYKRTDRISKGSA